MCRQVFSLLAAIGNVGYPVLADFLEKRAVVSRVRLMGITLFVYGCVFTGIWLMTHLHGGGNPSDTMKWIMFCLMSSVGFGFGAALVGFPVCVSVAFPVEYFGYVPYHVLPAPHRVRPLMCVRIGVCMCCCPQHHSQLRPDVGVVVRGGGCYADRRHLQRDRQLHRHVLWDDRHPIPRRRAHVLAYFCGGIDR